MSIREQIGGNVQATEIDRVCFLSAHLPNSSSVEAGQRVAYEHLQAIAEQFPVHLLAMANGLERKNINGELFQICESVTIVPVSWTSRLFGLVSSPQLPAYVALRANPKVRRWVNVQREESMNPVFWAEYAQMAQYARGRPTKERWIAVCQDVLSQLIDRRLFALGQPFRSVARWEAKRVRRWERDVLSHIDCTVLFSEKDKELLGHIDGQCVVIRPRVQVFPTSDFDNHAPTILYWGAMNRSENEDAVCWFAADVLPRIQACVPDVRLLVVGGHPSAKTRLLSQRHPGITVTGFVPDPTSFFSQSWFSIAPLRFGGGVKIKVLQSLGSGRAVVASPVGSEGVEATETDGLLIAREADEFVEVCCRLLRSPEECALTGRSALRWFAESYATRLMSENLLREVLTGIRQR